ncbi:hypothetical protein A6770_22130 [Nostoc minutum NIES-26]|uniref:LysM domain-containing protein n=1 Tax=Nostoc minutum NIES-26 TaxID=1844469 RepID=A0A367R1V8_9NOSO|nr:hypothetical protein A6770_22130 [Nostoc minutum NIES-26]
MFEYTSRYYSLETANFITTEGREIAYKRRRFLPQVQGQTILAEVTIAEGDRLDLISARLLGDPEQFWHLCDINNAMHPDELTTPSGRVLGVALPQGKGASPAAALPQV